MPSLADHIHALIEVTGWQSLANPDSAGVRRVALENDLDAVFFPLGDKKCILRGVVVDLPDKESESDALCNKAAATQVAVLRERPSVLAFEASGQSLVPGEAPAHDRLICFRSVSLEESTNNFVTEVQDWLNDLAWWKATLGQTGTQNTEGNSPFSLNMFSGLKL